MREIGQTMLNHPVDVADDYENPLNLFFTANSAVSFDESSGQGEMRWDRHACKPRMAFDQIVGPFEKSEAWEFPPEYPVDFQLPFAISFIDERTLRLRLRVQPHGQWRNDGDSPMLAGPVPTTDAWQRSMDKGAICWRGPHGSLRLTMDPWRLELFDAAGKLLTQTHHLADTCSLVNHEPTPFSFVRRTSDLQRTIAASFLLAPDEKIFGCGESFTRLNKRGQRLPLWTCDAHGAQSRRMYKPIPFYLSSRGYGLFVHGTTPMTFDFGHDYDNAAVLYVADTELDCFIFLGEPAEILESYTARTGRSPVPPLWSFGLWMSRITYKSEEETRGVLRQLRDQSIPCDVIHLDTGWFETNWQCNYRFSPSRFDDPAAMIADLRQAGCRISLWQLPYFTPTNELFADALAKGFIVTNGDGGLPTEDAIIDFSNPDAVAWYQSLLRPLLEMGVGAIKVDFGESGPYHGAYASGRTGHYEHNLYPLRYNRAAFDVTREVTGDSIIWARSAWAGSQRYPLHWGGDAENTDSGMAASLRSGLSFGLCGFSFWSHDAGGFVKRSPRALYRRWMPFGMLTSHSRCHGAPPKEPWHYDEAFTNDFRRAVELKYALMPYIYTQAVIASEHGWPLLRPLFFHYPADPTSWLVEDAYLFGRDLLVAPLMEESSSRQVYCPPGRWIDYQGGAVYEGERWHQIEAGEIPVILLVREGAVIPHAPVAQHTGEIDWQSLELRVYLKRDGEAHGCVTLPGEERMHQLDVTRIGDALTTSPALANATWRLTCC